MQYVVNAISITRWSIQMNFDYDMEHMQMGPLGFEEQAMLNMNRQVFLDEKGEGDQWTPVLVLLTMGSVLRLFSFCGLRFTHRDKQV